MGLLDIIFGFARQAGQQTLQNITTPPPGTPAAQYYAPAVQPSSQQPQQTQQQQTTQRTEVEPSAPPPRSILSPIQEGMKPLNQPTYAGRFGGFMENVAIGSRNIYGTFADRSKEFVEQNTQPGYVRGFGTGMVDLAISAPMIASGAMLTPGLIAGRASTGTLNENVKRAIAETPSGIMSPYENVKNAPSWEEGAGLATAYMLPFAKPLARGAMTTFEKIPYTIGVGKQKGVLVDVGKVAVTKESTRPGTSLVTREALPKPETWQAFATRSNKGKAEVLVRPPKAQTEAVVSILRDTTYGDLTNVKTPFGSYVRYTPKGPIEDLNFGNLKRIGGSIEKPSLAEKISQHIRIEKKLLIDPAEFKLTHVKEAPLLPEITWDYEVRPKSPGGPGGGVEYDMWGGNLKGRPMYPTDPLISGMPERPQLMQRKATDLDAFLSMNRKEAMAVKAAERPSAPLKATDAKALKMSAFVSEAMNEKPITELRPLSMTDPISALQPSFSVLQDLRPAGLITDRKQETKKQMQKIAVATETDFVIPGLRDLKPVAEKGEKTGSQTKQRDTFKEDLKVVAESPAERTRKSSPDYRPFPVFLPRTQKEGPSNQFKDDLKATVMESPSRNPKDKPKDHPWLASFPSPSPLPKPKPEAATNFPSMPKTTIDKTPNKPPTTTIFTTFETPRRIIKKEDDDILFEKRKPDKDIFRTSRKSPILDPWKTWDQQEKAIRKSTRKRRKS